MGSPQTSVRGLSSKAGGQTAETGRGIAGTAQLDQGRKRGVAAGVGQPSILVSFEQRPDCWRALDELLWGQLRVRCDRLSKQQTVGRWHAVGHCPRRSHRNLTKTRAAERRERTTEPPKALGSASSKHSAHRALLIELRLRQVSEELSVTAR